MEKEENSTWNHRVLAHLEPNGEIFFQVHEVHYTDGNPVYYGDGGAKIGGADLDELMWSANEIWKCVHVIGSKLEKNKILWAGAEFPKEYSMCEHPYSSIYAKGDYVKCLQCGKVLCEG